MLMSFRHTGPLLLVMLLLIITRWSVGYEGIAIAQERNPAWEQYPRIDAHPCTEQAQCTQGLTCREKPFEISTQIICASDRDCPRKRVLFRGNTTLPTTAHCEKGGVTVWGSTEAVPAGTIGSCVYWPEPRRWCSHVVTLWDAPKVSQRKCSK